MKRKTSKPKRHLPQEFIIPNLPIELWSEILTRLPSNSLYRFRSVSPQWRSLIDHPDFPQSHLANFNTPNRRESHLLSIERHQTLISDAGNSSNSSNCLIRSGNSFVPVTDPINLTDYDLPVDDIDEIAPSFFQQHWLVVAWSDGILVLKNEVFEPYNDRENYSLFHHGFELVLWNPTTRELRNLPPPPNQQNNLIGVDLGAGFDPAVSDYKFVRFWMTDYNELKSIVVYRYNTDSWAEIPHNWDWNWDVRRRRFSNLVKSVCFRGILFAIAQNLVSKAMEVIWFRLRDGEFGVASLPVDPEVDDRDNLVDPAIVLLDGGSGLGVVLIGRKNGSIWVWEGVCGSADPAWRKRCAFSSRIPERYGEDYDGAINFVYVKSDGEMIIQWLFGLVSFYNLETHEERVAVRNEGVYVQIRAVYPHVENMLRLN